MRVRCAVDGVCKMPCYMPLKAYRAPGGRIVFSAKAGFSDLPVTLPCGQCIGCRIERGRQWALRCVHEAQQHVRNCFITLTYKPDCLPDDGSVDVREWQLFAKRLRKVVGPFRFFHCGEYGDENFRPHYHALLFGVDFASDRVAIRRVGEHYLYQSRLLDDVWERGFATIGSVSFQSAAYVARYCMKKANGPLAKERYRRIDLRTGEEYFVKPEYVTMSRNPGIGAGWFKRYRKDVFPSDEVVHEGRRFRTPRYYDDLLERVSPEELESVKAKRRARVAARASELTEDRLRVKEVVAAARLSRLKRSV